MSEKILVKRVLPDRFYKLDGTLTVEGCDAMGQTADPEFDLRPGTYSFSDGKGGFNHGIQSAPDWLPTDEDVERHPSFQSLIGHTTTKNAAVPEIAVEATTADVEAESPPPYGLRLVPGVAPKNTDH